MEGIKMIVFVFILCGFQFCTVQSKECVLESHVSGQIVSIAMSGGQNCWTITVPPDHLIQLKFINFGLKNHCDKENVRINVTGRHEYQYCRWNDVKSPITAFANVTVIHFVRYSGVSSKVTIEYKVEKFKCKNRVGFFECEDSSCVPQEKVCNGLKDCRNSEDEIGCGNFPCTESSFKCYDSSCVSEDKVCNGMKDCINGEDEFGCGAGQNRNCALQPYVSGKIFSDGMHGGFEKCWTIPIPPGHLIHLKFINLIRNNPCEEENIRINVTGRHQYQFCGSEDVENPVTAFGDVSVIHFTRFAPQGSYVTIEYKVEKIQCKNRVGFFECDDNTCVPQEKICDGLNDCRNGEDETGCGNFPCTESSFKCYDSSCVPEDKVCNGVKDCRNGEDEFGCDTVQSQNCALQPYISGKIFSDGMHGGFEKCWTIPIPPGHLIHLRFINLIMNNPCKEENIQINVTGRHQYQFCGSEVVKNTVTAFGDVSVIHFRRYSPQGSFVTVEYKVEKIQCKNRVGFFKCDDNTCIPQEKLCDGVNDCTNGEDEIGCANVCWSNPCKNGGKCIDSGGHNFTCECVKPYTGEICETANSCWSNPCKNGGKCIDSGGHNFTCECVKPYTGDICETACICRGGNCEMEGKERVCKCPPGYGNFTKISCRVCGCGPDSNCMWKGFDKVCLCKSGYSGKRGKCVDCECGPDSSCEFISEGWLNPVKKVCHCKPGYNEVDGKCVDEQRLQGDDAKNFGFFLLARRLQEIAQAFFWQLYFTNEGNEKHKQDLQNL